jgi:hypothetical protein
MISFDRPEVLYILVDISATALGAQRLIKFDILNVLTSAPTILEPSYRIIGNMSRFENLHDVLLESGLRALLISSGLRYP